jgi:hypothetical protein
VPSILPQTPSAMLNNHKVNIVTFGIACNIQATLLRTSGFCCKEHAKLKISAFLDVASCSLVEVDWRFRCAYCVNHPGAGDGGGTQLWNVAVKTYNFSMTSCLKIAESNLRQYLADSFFVLMLQCHSRFEMCCDNSI